MGSERDICHRRDCDDEAVFLIREQYQEETGKGLVEATAKLCQTHANEESPTNLKPVTPDYLFEVTVLESSNNSVETQ